MKQLFKFLDGILTIETVNGRAIATLTDADGNSETLTEYTAPGCLTEEQKEAINRRFGEPKKDGQPF